MEQIKHIVLVGKALWLHRAYTFLEDEVGKTIKSVTFYDNWGLFKDDEKRFRGDESSRSVYYAVRSDNDFPEGLKLTDVHAVMPTAIPNYIGDYSIEHQLKHKVEVSQVSSYKVTVEEGTINSLATVPYRLLYSLLMEPKLEDSHVEAGKALAKLIIDNLNLTNEIFKPEYNELPTGFNDLIYTLKPGVLRLHKGECYAS